jgi:hypothetical protein
MANGSSTLARIQGRGLVETTTTAAEQTGAQLATTPAGAMEQGRGPDSAKMAGTPPAKVNALRVAMQDVGSRRLEAIRDVAKEDIAADQRVTGIRQKASVLGRLDENMAEYINAQLKAAFTASLIPKGATLKDSVYKDNQQKRTDLSAAVGKILAGTATDADINTVNAALPKNEQIKFDKDTAASTNAAIIANNLYDNMTPAQMQAAFGTAVTAANANTTLEKFLVDPAADTLAQSEGLADSDELTVLLKSILPKDADLSKMRLGDVTAAIQKWKEDEFKDVTTYQQTLSDPMASKAQRDLAAENLRRLGKIGVLALDQKVGDLDAQMQDGDTVMLGDQSFEISEFFEKPEALAQLKGWLDKPDTAPTSLKGWIEANRDAIQTKVNELSPDLQDLSNKVEANLKNLSIDENWKPADQIMEEFFGDLTKPSLDNKLSTLSADDQAKFKLLQDANTGPAMNELLTTLSKNSFALSGTGIKGTDIYKNLTAADLQQIAKTGVQPFIQNVIAQKRAKDFVAQPANIETAGSEVRQFLELIGIPDTGLTFSRLASNKNLNEFQDIFNQAGLGDLLAGGQFNIQGLKDKVKQLGLTTETKPSASILDGSNLKTMREYFSTTLGKLRKAIASPPLKTTGTAKENDAKFRRVPGSQHPEDVAFQLEQDWGERSMFNRIELNEATKARKEWTNNNPEPITWYGGKDKGWSEWDWNRKWHDEQVSRLENEPQEVANRVSDLRTNPKYMADYRKRFDAWFNTEVENMNKDNKTIQEKYTKLSDIIGGLA